jgi:hypothetical protein
MGERPTKKKEKKKEKSREAEIFVAKVLVGGWVGGTGEKKKKSLVDSKTTHDRHV